MGREFGEFTLQEADPLWVEPEGWEVGVRKITIVVALFLGPHRPQRPVSLVPKQGLLNDLSTGVEDPGLPFGFGHNGTLYRRKGVEVLDFRLHAILIATVRSQRHIGVDSEAALFHVAVTDIQVFERALEFLKESPGLRRRAQIRLGHDLDERCTGSVEVHRRSVGNTIMNRLPRVLLEVNATNSDRPCLAVRSHRNNPLGGQRFGELRDLIPLREIGIEVALPCEDAHLVHLASQTERRDDRQIDRFAIEHWQGPGKAQADRTYLAVGFSTESGPIRAKKLFGRAELHVHLQADHQLPCHSPSLPNRHPVLLISIPVLHSAFQSESCTEER